ncbi:GTPase Era [Desulfatibacillum aliphaticivorans]|uniref:GTPase Era n=1 Tax=Desulfatibacillum aliphaticivorans TaxID=218208 RepID=UPI0004079D3E|nr:GTPase Era [Desulfatibacillum aliphaticivorans]
MFENFKSGFIGMIGAPNVGKSTLLNQMLGEKVSITSSKPQTTRNRILGVVHREKAQLVMLDTPGIHSAKSPLNKHMVDVAMQCMGDVDLIMFVVDASKPDPNSERLALKGLAKQKMPVILVLNKIDLIKKETLLPLIAKWEPLADFKAIVPVSAETGEQVEELIAILEEQLPQGPPFFPEDSLTDMPERFVAAEMIREKVFRMTSQEIPYSVAVTLDSFTEQEKPPMVKISAVIHVERDSQKGIIIGKQGAMLKKIGTSARQEIERMVGVKVFLKLFVRVEKNWSTDTKAMRRLGYE